RLARSGVDEAVVERDEARLGPQLRDVDSRFVLGAPDDRELDFVLVVAQDSGGLAHLRLLHLIFLVSFAVPRSTRGPCRRRARRTGSWLSGCSRQTSSASPIGPEFRAATAPPIVTRSFMSVVSETRHPSPSPPMRSASGTRTTVRYTSLNSASPVIWRNPR